MRPTEPTQGLHGRMGHRQREFTSHLPCTLAFHVRRCHVIVLLNTIRRARLSFLHSCCYYVRTSNIMELALHFFVPGVLASVSMPAPRG